MSDSSNHFIFSIYPLHGHARALVSIACNLLALHPRLHVTLLINPQSDKAVAGFIGEHRDASVRDDGRLKVIGCLKDRIGFSLDGVWDDLDTNVKGGAVSVYTDLLRGSTSTWDMGKGQAVEGLCGLRPNLIICDMLEIARSKSAFEGDLPLYIFLPAPVASYIQHFAGPPYGGPIPLMRAEGLKQLRASGKFDASISDDELVRTDEFEAIAVDMYKSGSTAEMVTCPGAPDMLAYEYFPQVMSMPVPPTGGRYLSHAAHQALNHGRGAVLPWSSSVLEPDAEEGAHKIWPKDWSAFAVGAQGPNSLWNLHKGDRALMKDGDREVLSFLDAVETKYSGQKRAMYISFGSLWFPLLRQDLIVHLIETLLDLPEEDAIPFVFALASPFANIDDSLRERVKASGRGLLSTFAPQYEVLVHPATGWFLSHCGSNSSSEALICGVPLVCWPSLADQPGIAAQLTLELDVGFELIQVRTPPPFLLPLPTARGTTIVGTPEAITAEMKDVFSRMRGEEGERKRANIQKLSAAMRKDRKEGHSKESLLRLGRIGLA